MCHLPPNSYTTDSNRHKGKVQKKKACDHETWQEVWTAVADGKQPTQEEARRFYFKIS